MVAGRWDWLQSDDACGAFIKTFSFPPNEMTMVVVYGMPAPNLDALPGAPPTDTVVYDIQRLTSNYVRGLIRGETRTTEAGDPVVWDLVLLSRDAFCWQRTDGDPDGCSSRLVRCPG